MTQSTILVIGATGTLGAPVAQSLKANNFTVRLLVRDAAHAKAQFGTDFEYRVGDVRDTESVRVALTGCDGVYISLQGRTAEEFETVEHQGTATIARLAAQLGIKRIGYLSGALVNEENTHVPQEKAKWLAEQAIEQSGVPYTIFKPTFFMESLPMSVQGKRATVMGTGNTPFRFIAVADYAVMVSAAFKQTGTESQRYFVFGSQPLTMRKAMQTYCEKVRPEVKVSVTPFWMMGLINRLFMGGKLTATIDLMKLTALRGDSGDNSSTIKAFGAPQLSFDQWCAQQAAHQ